MSLLGSGRLYSRAVPLGYCESLSSSDTFRLSLIVFVLSVLFSSHSGFVWLVQTLFTIFCLVFWIYTPSIIITFYILAFAKTLLIKVFSSSCPSLSQHSTILRQDSTITFCQSFTRHYRQYETQAVRRHFNRTEPYSSFIITQVSWSFPPDANFAGSPKPGRKALLEYSSAILQLHQFV